MNQPTSEEQTVDRDGYQLTFYPGFASRCTIREADGSEHELYRQQEPYRLPPGQTRPRDQHRIRLRGGRRRQDITLDVHDPEHRIARIVVELYGEGHQPGGGSGDQPVETMTVDQDSQTCPPHCE